MSIVSSASVSERLSSSGSRASKAGAMTLARARETVRQTLSASNSPKAFLALAKSPSMEELMHLIHLYSSSFVKLDKELHSSKKAIAPERRLKLEEDCSRLLFSLSRMYARILPQVSSYRRPKEELLIFECFLDYILRVMHLLFERRQHACIDAELSRLFRTDVYCPRMSVLAKPGITHREKLKASATRGKLAVSREHSNILNSLNMRSPMLNTLLPLPIIYKMPPEYQARREEHARLQTKRTMLPGLVTHRRSGVWNNNNNNNNNSHSHGHDHASAGRGRQRDRVTAMSKGNVTDRPYPSLGRSSLASSSHSGYTSEEETPPSKQPPLNPQLEGDGTLVQPRESPVARPPKVPLLSMINAESLLAEMSNDIDNTQGITNYSHQQ
jgi:hypothetical protein